MTGCLVIVFLGASRRRSFTAGLVRSAILSHYATIGEFVTSVVEKLWLKSSFPYWSAAPSGEHRGRPATIQRITSTIKQPVFFFG